MGARDEPLFEGGFEWDVDKSDKTYLERALDFRFAARVFQVRYAERTDTRRAYGEPRYIVTGEVDGILVSVVWTPRENRRRIIACWPASNRDRREYRKAFDTRDPDR